MSTLIVSQYFYPEPNGSAPPITDLAQWLADNNLCPRIITARPNYPDRRVFDGYRNGELDTETWHGIDIRRLPVKVIQDTGIIGRLITEGSFALSLLAYRMKGPRNSSHLVSVCPSIFVTLLAPIFLRKGGRHIAIVHDIQSGLAASSSRNRLLVPALRWLEHTALNRANSVITLSDEMREQLRKLGVKSPIRVLPPQLDVSQFDMLPDPCANIAVYSGAMGKKQGLSQLIDAAAQLERNGSAVKFIIRGQGGIRSELEARAHANQLSNIVFEDLAPADQFNTAMALGSVHLVPQTAEGADFAVPSKVFAIMACSRPFVATAFPGTPLAAIATESGAGVCVKPGDERALAEAIDKLMSDPDKRIRMGRLGRAFVENYADRKIVCSAIWNELSK